MILVDNISKTFRLYRKPSDRLKELFFRTCRHKAFKAVDNVSFQVDPGQTLGIIGRNGAGKSTILKLLTGVLIPDSGHVGISGKITGLLELGTGFNPEFSGLDNIVHNATYLGLSRQEIDARMDRITAFTELGDFINEPIKTYSSGMVMRLAFSVAIHADPAVFVVDEALSVGDAYFQQKCMRKIRAFKENGGAIVFVSHDMNAVKVLCDRAILLEHGKVVFQGDPNDTINQYNFLLARHGGGADIQFLEEEEQRGYGNRKAEIQNAVMEDEHGTPADILISGRPAGISIRIKANQDVADLTLGIAIRDRFGQDIFGTNTFHLNLHLSLKKGQTITARFSFKEFNLGTGKYALTAALHTGADHVEQCIHWKDGCAVFEVVTMAKEFFTGLARLVPALTVVDDENTD